MPQIVPVQPVANQTFQVLLDGQQTTIDLSAVYDNVFVDVSVNGSLVVAGVIAEQANVIVRDAYLGFSGDLVFYDTQPDPVNGAEDPQFGGLGTRWILAYLLPEEIPAGIS